MNPKTPNEIFVALALAVADTLECPGCPEELRDALNDTVVNELIDLLSADNINMLRALASLAKSGDGRERPEAESFAVAKSHSTAAALNGAAGK